MLLGMKGMWFEWLPSLTGPVPLLTKERCLVVSTLPVVVKHSKGGREMDMGWEYTAR